MKDRRLLTDAAGSRVMRFLGRQRPGRRWANSQACSHLRRDSPD